METEPQNFSGNYPLGGEQIGPAWREAWRILSETSWIERGAIMKYVASRSNVIEKTVGGLLWKAEKVGILEKKVKSDGTQKRLHYRVVKKNQNA